MQARILLGVIGGAVLIAGSIGAFSSDNGPGTAALVGVGGALFVLAALGDVVSFKAGSISIDRRQMAADIHKQEAETRAEAGDLTGAQQEWSAALRIIDPVDDLAQAYEAIRQHVPPGSPRTSMFMALSDAVRRVDPDLFPDLYLAQRNIRSASDGERIVILCFLQKEVRSALPEAIIEVIGDSRSAHEQREALVVAEGACASWSEGMKLKLAEVLRTQTSPTGWIKPRGARYKIVEQISQKLDPVSASE